MIYTARVDNFYLTAEQLASSPSRADGINEATEQELRHYCCDLVAEAVVLLRQPQVVAATAQVLVQRFYCKRSLKKFDVKHVAMAAFWLACKLEEVIEIDNPQRLTLRNVITVMDRVVRRRDGRSLAIMDPYSQRYEEMKQQATKAERHMLRAFGFVLHVEHPHRFVLNYCQMLACSKEVQQEAWNMANDSLRSTLCVRYRAEVVACGILFTAARKLKVPMPENPPWWQLFEVTETELYDVCTILCDLYRQPRAVHAPLGSTPPGAAEMPPCAKSPLSMQQGTPLRSPTSAAPSTVGSLAGLPAASAEPQRSEGQAPSSAQQQACSDKQQQKSGDGGVAGRDPSTGENGTTVGPGSDGRKPQPDSSKQDDGSKAERRRSRSRSRSRSRRRSRSREKDKKRGRSRSRSREKERDRGSKRDRREDRLLYRPGGRPPRRDDRRREGTHRPGAHVALPAPVAAPAS